MSLPPPDYSLSKLPEHIHQRILTAAVQVGRPVLVAGKVEYIRNLNTSQDGGRIEMLVYLTGVIKPVDASEVTLQELPE